MEKQEQNNDDDNNKENKEKEINEIIENKISEDNIIKCLLIIANIGFLVCSTTSIPLVFYTLKQNFFSTYKFIIRKKNKKIEMEIEDNDINSINNNNSINDNNSNDTNNENDTNSYDNNIIITSNNITVESERNDSLDNIDDNKKIKINISKPKENSKQCL